MTVDTTGSGGALAAYDEDSIGLEDLGAADVALPRMNIAHADGVFRLSTSGDVFDTLNVIMLGMIRQRIMWHPEVDDGDRPMCKSPDFEHGFPNMSDQTPADKRFPWAESNFEPSQAVPVVLGPTQSHPEGFNSNGHRVLPCNSCVFKEWGKSAGGKSVPPPCNEQFTFPILFEQDGNWLPAILTLQRTGIKPAKSYMSSFVQSRTPLFSAITQLRLSQQSRGSVRYSVPVITKAGVTDRSMWPEYAEQMKQIRTWLRSAPRGEELEVTESDNSWEESHAAAPAAPVAAPAPAPAAPVAAAPVTAPPAPAAATPAPPSTPAMASPAVADEDDDDIPF